MEGSASLTTLFFKWWYGEAYTRLLKYIKAAYMKSADIFSVKICLRTLFAPWKRDLISYDGLTLQQKFEVWTLNLASRFIGALIKSMTLLSFLIFIVLVTVVSLLAMSIWLIYPLIVAYLIYRLVVRK